MKAFIDQTSSGPAYLNRFTHKQVMMALMLAVILQGVVLVGMYALSALPLLTGTEIRLKTVPVDPRSLFRGNYARLRYDISSIDAGEFSVHQHSVGSVVNQAGVSGARLRQGEVVYVQVEPAGSGLYEFAGVQLTAPEQGVYLRGRVQNYSGGDQPSYEINYGIEAFFAPKEKALALEKQLRDSGVAVLKVSAGGTVRLEDVVATESGSG